MKVLIRPAGDLASQPIKIGTLFRLADVETNELISDYPKFPNNSTVYRFEGYAGEFIAATIVAHNSPDDLVLRVAS